MDKLLRLDTMTQSSVDKIMAELDNYNRSWKVQQYLSVDQLRELQHLASVQSIGSSNRIEGNKLSDEEIATLITHLQIQALQSRDEQEVVGYYNVLEVIQEQYEDLELSEFLIKGLHNEMLRYCTKDSHHRGQYKQLSNQVVATDAHGSQRVIFQTTDPALTPIAMEQAVAWYQEQLSAKRYHPLVCIGAFIYEFLTIHPFQDGNGRMSRLLTTMLLLQQGYEFILYASLERVIEEDKAGYYKALMTAQRYRGTAEEQIGRWLYYLLSAIRKLSRRLRDDEQMIAEEPVALYMNARQRKVLEFIRQEGELAVREIDALLPDISRNTVKYDLRKLTEAGLLRAYGKGRGTVYNLATQ